MTDGLADPIARLRDVLHPSVFVDRKNLRGYGVHGRQPQCVALPANVDAVSRCLAASAALDLTTVPTGIGARMRIGTPPHRYDVALCTRDLNRIVAHPAGDLTVTVEAGCPLTTLNGTLARSGQWVPLDPPLPERTTVGGLIATGTSGPLRFSQGRVRDLLIGVTVALADGRIVHAGGRVVKNVAGYDLMKLFTGSWGTLGVIVEATFKVMPRPSQTVLVAIETRDVGEAASAALEIGAAPLAPLYIEAVSAPAASAIGLGDQSSRVLVGLGGTTEEVDVQRERLSRLVSGRPQQDIHRSEAVRLYTALRDWPALSADPATLGATLSVLPSRVAELLPRLETPHTAPQAMSLIAHVGSGVVCIRAPSAGDRQRDLSWFEEIRDCAAGMGGFATFDVVPSSLIDAVDPWGTPVPGLQLMRGIKSALDPTRLLSPGRFVGGI